MSAVRRERPVRLPSELGMVGALVTEASDEHLRACLAQDQRWLYGGEMVVDEETRTVRGFLGDESQNPRGYEDVHEYLAHTDQRSPNFRVVRRIAVRIEAIESELARRAERQHDENARRRDEARAKLDAWRKNLPSVVTAFQRQAELAAQDWAFIEPVVRAMERLQSMAPSAQADLPSVYAQLQARSHELGCDPPPDLPAGVPSHEDVRRAANVLSKTTWADSRVPSTGLERINLDRTLREAGG